MKVESQQELHQATSDDAAAFCTFVAELMRLKAVPRLGWLLRGIRDVESVADHSYGVALIAMLLADMGKRRGLEVDSERVLRMSLLHDLTEVRTGDLPSTIKRYFDRQTLHAADTQAANEVLVTLGALGEEYLALWEEYESRVTIESRIVKAADKLDLLFQAREYEKGGAQSLDEFWLNSRSDSNVPEVPSFQSLIDDLFTKLAEDRGRNG